MSIKTGLVFALFEVLLVTISLITGLKIEIEFIINSILLALLTFWIFRYANEGILVDNLIFSINKMSFYSMLGLFVGLLASYILWIFSESTIVRNSDWYEGFIVQSFRFGFGSLSILLSIGVISIFRRMSFNT